MAARPIDEPHRASSQLELLFDLIFVVAIAASPRSSRTRSRERARARRAGPVPAGLLRDLVGVDELHLVRVVLRHRRRPVPAADPACRWRACSCSRRACPSAVEDGDFRAVTLGYLVMRIGLVAQWLRAALEDPASRRTALRYAAGITIAEVGVAAAPAGSRRPGCCRDVGAAGLFVALVRPRAARCRCGPSGRGRPAGTRTTSPSATGCSRSSCSARACSRRPPACERRARGRRRERSAGDDRARRPRARLRPLVAVLPAARRARASPIRRDRSYLLGLRPLRHLRRARGARRRARGRGRADRAPRRGVTAWRSATRSRSRSACSSS